MVELYQYDTGMMSRIILNIRKGVLIVIPDGTLPGDAEVAMPIDTIPKRMNVGAMYEPYFAGISRTVKEFIVGHYNLTGKSTREIVELTTRATKDNEKYIKELCKSSIERIHNTETDTCFNYILNMIKELDGPMYKHYLELSDSDRRIVLEDVFVNEMTMLYRVDDGNSRSIINAWDENGMVVEDEMLSFINPFSGHSEVVQLIDSMKPMPMYFVIQSKIPFDGLLTNTSQVNHFGLPVTVSSINKHRLPFKNNPSKTYDETFTRIMTAHTPARMVAELMSRASSPLIQQLMCVNILNAKVPTNIDTLIDRSKIGYGQSNALRFAKHILQSGGVELKYIKDNHIEMPYKG